MNDFRNNRNSNNGERFIMTVRTIEMFADNVKMVMEDYFGYGYSVTVQKVNKNNGVVLTGLLITDNKTNLVPTIYLDGLYKRYLNGEEMVDICREIITVYEENRVHTDFDVSSVTNFDKVKNRICYKLINADKNKELLQDVTYIPFHDLAIVFYVLVSQDADGTAIITVKKSFEKMWGMDADSLFPLALQNTQRLFRGRVTSIAETMTEILASKVGEETVREFYDMAAEVDDMIPLYVATNHMKMDGAGIIFYENLLKDFAKKVNSDFYIIPSSVHEVLFVPVSAGIEPAYVKKMVVNVNATELLPQEVLSDNVYYYSRKLDRVEML